MKAKIVAVVLCVLAALGLVNIGKSLTHRFFGDDHKSYVRVHTQADEHIHVKRDVRRAIRRAAGDDVVVDERFSVEQGGTLELGIGHADVTIETSGDDVATVRVTLSGRDMDTAREYFESLNFETRQDGNRIIVKTNPTRKNWNWQSNGGARIKVDVMIPRRFNASMSVAHGDLRLGDLVGDLELRNAHGDAEIGSIDGESVSIKTAHGDVELVAVKARYASFKTAHGDLTTGALSADELELKSAHGDIDVDVRGGRSIDVVNSHGNIELALHTSIGGSIRNNHGDIDIEASEGLAANVYFQGDKIRVAGGHSFEGSQTRGRYEGALNGGGPTLRAQTSFGSTAVN